MILPDFEPQPGLHCESSALRMMLAYAGLCYSEAMIFGLGQGLDFVVWPGPDDKACECLVPRRGLPLLAGRIDSCAVAQNFAAVSGVELVVEECDDVEEAMARLREILAQGKVVGLKLDIFYLPYFSSRRHFCAHFIAAFGIEGEVALVVDTAQQGGVHRVPLADLAMARTSREGLQCSRNLSIHVGARAQAAPLRSSLPVALARCARHYLQPPDPRRGAPGLERVAQGMNGWLDHFDDPAATLRSIAQFWEFAGTGGANFRRLYAAFLEEAQQELDCAPLAEAALRAREVEEGWSAAIRGLNEVAETGDRSQMAVVADGFVRTVAKEGAMMRAVLGAAIRLDADA